MLNNLMTKALLASMSVSAVFAQDVQVIDITDHQSGETFEVLASDSIKFEYTGPMDLDHMEVLNSELYPQPYNVTGLEPDCWGRTDQAQELGQRWTENSQWHERGSEEYGNVITSATTGGNSDWAYGHARIWSAGSTLTLEYDIPIAEIREQYPDATFSFRSSYFAAWNNADIIVDTRVNGWLLHDSIAVGGEHKGRTQLDENIDELIGDSETGVIEIEIESGWGPLFLWYFAIWVENIGQAEEIDTCTWSWLVEPWEIFSDRNGHEASATFDLNF